MDEIPAEFWQGVEQFNQQEFYACHDTLEAIWINALPSDKNFFQGILQIAVALHHLSNENWRGAVILMGEGVSRLRSYPSDYGDIDVDSLVDDAATLLKQLQVMGADQVGAIAQQLRTGLSEIKSFDDTILKLPKIERI
ncbi:MAG: DUF309 domain-containing protein [Leptolyngbyaceae cyanobacterium bins.302]|nr:DUF309 domain-containing protein [Leptolyngbyaceae cyanobacterium bins.302]